ncbi:3-keto-disaccharide hydrolase [Maribacter sp. CXY002]|uniref:3-keto-disaccharide hydrolase n=1 Tax=Maribacter luteocoastalis TaxID=3407671 RepID=UPI003B66FC3A
MMISTLRIFRIFFLLATLLITACKNLKTKVVENQEEQTTNNWIPIFNGKDLDGWTMKINGYPVGENFGNTFRVKDSILSIRYDAYGPEFGERFGALFYDRELTNYRLKVTYRFVGDTAPGAPEWGYRDSGVQIHTQPPNTVQLNQSFPICLEYNLHGGNGTEDRPLGAICGIGMKVEVDGERSDLFCNPAKVGKTFHGDQWVTIEIDVKDGKMKHFVNGEEIMSYANPIYDTKNEFAQAFIQEGDSTVKSGYISLQSNSHPIDFKKIELLKYN